MTSNLNPVTTPFQTTSNRSVPKPSYLKKDIILKVALTALALVAVIKYGTTIKCLGFAWKAVVFVAPHVASALGYIGKISVAIAPYVAFALSHASKTAVGCAAAGAMTVAGGILKMMGSFKSSSQETTDKELEHIFNANADRSGNNGASPSPQGTNSEASDKSPTREELTSTSTVHSQGTVSPETPTSVKPASARPKKPVVLHPGQPMLKSLMEQAKQQVTKSGLSATGLRFEVTKEGLKIYFILGDELLKHKVNLPKEDVMKLLNCLTFMKKRGLTLKEEKTSTGSTITLQFTPANSLLLNGSTHSKSRL